MQKLEKITAAQTINKQQITSAAQEQEKTVTLQAAETAEKKVSNNALCAANAKVSHPFAPVWDTQSRVLILGSFPSVLSRQNQFYYGNPQNRFWRVLSELYRYPLPQTVAEKRALLADTHIALWDVIASCEVHGSADASIRNARPNDLTPLLNSAPIQAIFTNGATADTFYRRYLFSHTNIPAVRLPSTSPANAAWSLTRLCTAWQIVRIAAEKR